jgi:hypothetical protein
MGKLLDEAESGAADVSIAGISITSMRVKMLYFSHAFFETGLQIMVMEQSAAPGIYSARRQPPLQKALLPSIS